MAEAEEFRFRELERRVAKLESICDSVPVIVRDVQELRGDVQELRDDTRSLRRALYTTAFSIVSAALIFAFTASHFFG